MSTQFPPLSLFDEDEDSRFLNLFNRFSSQYPDVGTYLDPNDPDFQKYRELSTAPTGSENLISKYVENLPTREAYKPDLRTKMLGFLLGTLGGGERTAREYTERPFNQAIQDWREEGSNIGSRARLMDSERARQLQALKYSLQAKQTSARQKTSEELRGMSESRRIAAKVADEARQKKQDEATQVQRDISNNLAQSNADFRKHMAEEASARAAEANTRAEEDRKRKIQMDEEAGGEYGRRNKALRAFAEQHGIDVDKDRPVGSIAEEAAFAKLESDPVFGRYIKKDPSKLIGYSLVGSESEKIPVRARLRQIIQKYLSGAFD